MRTRVRIPHPLTYTDLSTTKPPVPPVKPPKPWEVRQAAANESATEAMAILQQMAAHLGGILNFEKATAEGDVLATIAVTIGSSGMWSHSWATPYAALTVANLGPSLLTVTSMVPMSQAPTSGTGVTRLRGGIQRTFAARSNVVTVYGAVGAQFDITAYARPRVPAVGRAVSGVYTRTVESVTPLAANGVFNGAAVDCGAAATRFRGWASSDQAGTINMQESSDGVTWYTTTSQPLAAGTGTGTVVELITTLRYQRVQVVNGTTLQTTFKCASSAVED